MRSPALLGLLLASLGCGRAAPVSVTEDIRLIGELPDATRDVPYEARLLVEPEGAVPVSFDLVEGRLPPGLEVVRSGVNELAIRGAPLDAGLFSFALSVRTQRSQILEQTFRRELEVVLPAPDAPLVLLTSRIPDARVGERYAAMLSGEGGIPPYTFIASTAPPEGLFVEPSGQVMGIPEVPSLGGFRVRIEDDIGQAFEASVAIDVLPDDVPRVATTALPPARVLRSYEVTLVGAGGDGGPYAWRLVEGSFPPGMDLRLRRGRSVELTGFPTIPGRYPFVLDLADDRGVRGRSSLSLDVVGPLTIVTEDLPVGREGVPYSVTLRAENVLPPLDVRLLSGFLPPGVRPNRVSDNVFELSGVPEGRGTFRFSLRFSDATDTVDASFLLPIPR